MTKEEAVIYLSIEDGQDLYGAYEEHLFKAKQFFLNRFPISKVFNGKLDKLLRMHEAFVLLGGENKEFEKNSVDFEFESSSILETFNAFNQTRSKLRIELNSSDSFPQVKWVIEETIKMTLAYAKRWQIKDEDLVSVKVSQEPDPMELLSALKVNESRNALSFRDLSGLDEENSLKREAKRLSLWLKMENNE